MPVKLRVCVVFFGNEKQNSATRDRYTEYTEYWKGN